MTSHNSGISISGGTVTTGAMAAGDHAQASNVTTTTATSVDQLRDQLADLVRDVRAHQHDLDDGEQAVALADLAAKEAAKEKPNRGSLLGLLRTLGAGVRSVASLTTAVTALEHAAAALF